MGVLAAESLSMAAGIVLGCVLLASGVNKMRDREAFGETIDKYEIGPPVFRHFVVRAVPLFELSLAGLWLSGYFVGAVALLTVALLGFFSGAMALAIRRGREFDCGCGGFFRSQTIGWHSLMRSVWLLGVAVSALALSPDSSYSPPNPLVVRMVVDPALGAATVQIAIILFFTLKWLDEITILRSKVTQLRLLFGDRPGTKANRP